MKKSDLARLVAVHMGLGHLRAAFPLRSLSQKGIIVWGSGSYAAPGEKNTGGVSGKFIISFPEWVLILFWAGWP